MQWGLLGKNQWQVQDALRLASDVEGRDGQKN